MVTGQIFVHKFLFTFVFFGKKGTKTHETFHILKLKTPFEKQPHFENENTFKKEWKLIPNLYTVVIASRLIYVISNVISSFMNRYY